MLFLGGQNCLLSRCGFCRFMIKQVEQICKCSRDNVRSQEQEGSSWSSLKDQICDTFVLRLVSCIQLASKLSLHYNVRQLNPFLKQFLAAEQILQCVNLP